MAAMDDLFNGKMLAFAQDLKRLNDGLASPVPELQYLDTGLQVLMFADRQKPRDLFHEHVTERYGPQIKARDEAFFLVSAKYDGVEASDMNLVELLKGVWQKLGAGDKDSVWKHLQLLVVLDEKLRR